MRQKHIIEKVNAFFTPGEELCHMQIFVSGFSHIFCAHMLICICANENILQALNVRPSVCHRSSFSLTINPI